MRKLTATASTLAIAGLLLSGCAGGGPGGSDSEEFSDGKIVIGALGDQSGALSALDGVNSVKAIEMAVADFRKNHGDEAMAENIEVIDADHKNDPAIANTLARRMYEREAVDIIIGMPNSAALLAVSKLALEKDRMVIGIPTGSTAFAEGDCNRATYLWTYNTAVMANSIGSYLTDQGMENWYILYADYAYGQDYAARLQAKIEEIGGNVVGTAAAPFPNDDFSAFMLKIRNTTPKPDVISLIESGTDLTNAVNAYREFGLAEQGIALTVGALFLTDIDSVGPEAVEGSIQATPWYWNMDDEARTWSDKYMEFSGVEDRPTFAQAGSYSATTQYLEAALRAGSDSADAVRGELDGYEFSDAFARNAEVRAADHTITKDMILVQVKSTTNITEDQDYLKVLETLPAADVWPAPSDKCVMD